MTKKTLLEIKYKDFIDENNNETIVILHGWWWKSDSWIKVAEMLFISWFNVIIPDLPGFWETKLNHVFDLDEYCKVISKFLKSLKIDDFILWGHSNWWSISIKIENAHIFNIKKLVLNNSAWIRNNKKRSFKRKILNKISKKIKPIFKNNNFPIIRKILYKIIGWQDYINSEKIPFLKETYKNIIKEDIIENIKKIDTDTLLIWWENDTFTPKEDAYIFRENIKKSKMTILQNQKHSIHLDNPVLLVDSFLKNI